MTAPEIAPTEKEPGDKAVQSLKLRYCALDVCELIVAAGIVDAADAMTVLTLAAKIFPKLTDAVFF